MLHKIKSLLPLRKNQTQEELIQEAMQYCSRLAHSSLSHLDIVNYTYTPDAAVDELGLDEELVQQLIEDYVAQVIRSVVQFEEYLKQLQDSKEQEKTLDYTPFRELAHKNLGVARNLRIKDAQVLLYELMKKDDLDYLLDCLEALKFCAIKLHPKCAYNTIKILEIKSQLV